MKAYSVTSDRAEASVIVFADTPAKARSLAHGTDWLCEEDFIELRARRRREIDHLAGTVATVLDGSGPEDARVMRSLGWYELEGSRETCKTCELYEWHGVPESVIVDDECAGCRHRDNEA